MMGGIIPERWAASNRNGGRDHLGMLGAISPESAVQIRSGAVGHVVILTHKRCWGA
jgi:hypothetical protein